MHSCSLVYLTPNAEDFIANLARVSNPKNQDNKATAPRLLRYLIDHKHWSPFEMVSMCVEINTTRAISPQILRHRSFSFQEFSQRYASPNDIGTPVLPEWRAQDLKNRQKSVDGLYEDHELEAFDSMTSLLYKQAVDTYNLLVANGVAKECARGILPLNTPTRLYMHGNIRSWIHYILVRAEEGTQKEHRLIAESAKEIFKQQLPVISAALGWSEDFTTKM
jgi:thymidylate synthase (FAD)